MADLEKSGAAPQSPPRIIIAEDDLRRSRADDGGERRRPRRRMSRSSFGRGGGDDEITPVPISGATTVPIEYRTLSIDISETRDRAEKAPVKASLVSEISSLNWHILNVDEVCRCLSTSLAQGLDEEQVARKRAQHGKNEHSPPPSHLFRRILVYIFGGFGSLLIVAGILCCVAWKPLGQPDPQVSNLALGIVLFIVAALQAFFNAWQDWSTSRVIASISGMLPSEVVVFRGGNWLSILASELVPGDLVQVRAGNKIPADLRLCECSSDLKFNRSILTGESDAVKGSVNSTSDNFLETKCIAMQGTHCISGSGTGIVILTGDNTVFGKIAALSAKRKQGLTTLQKEILRFVAVIASAIIVVSIVVIIVWAAWLRVDHPGFLNVSGLIVSVVSVSVAFIPEGLPIAVTMSLTIIARAMKKQKVLCKSLSTVETLGSINVLCSDKTGTLTENAMKVTTSCILSDEKEPSEAHQFLRAPENGEAAKAWKQLWHVAGLCCAAKFDAETIDKPVDERKILGDATDQATLRFAETLLPTNSLSTSWRQLLEVPFNSKNKFMLRIYEPNDLSIAEQALSHSEMSEFSSTDMIMFIKGAPDVLMPRCRWVLLPNGDRIPMSQSLADEITNTQMRWSTAGQRVLLLARRVISGADVEVKEFGSAEMVQYIVRDYTDDLVVVGMIGIVDPPRKDIPEVVRICRGGGIRFFMVTGDYAKTAEAIARQVGIITSAPSEVHGIANLVRNPSGDKVVGVKIQEWPTRSSTDSTSSSIVISGTELITLNENQWDQLCRYDEIVFARTTPEQKLRIVREFQARDCCVGMTGDGVNDAPSLKAADIGIAIGSGSDVAIEAADMVLLESFSAIVVAIEYGRLVFDNLKKTIIYLLPAGSWSELWPVLLNVFFGLPQILSSFLMIIICCLTDCAAAMTLVFEKPEADLLTRPPRNRRTDRLANPKLILHAYCFIGMIECTSSMAMAFWSIQRAGIPFSVIWFSFGNYPAEYDPDVVNAAFNQGSSIYFVNLVIMQFFNLMATRTRRLSILTQPPIIRKSTANYYLFPAMAFALGVVFFFLYIPFWQNVIGTVPIPYEYYLFPISYGFGLLLIDEARKYFVRKYPKGTLAKIAW